MGFFDDIETPVDEIPTGFGLPIGTYPVVLTDVKNVHNDEKNTDSIVLEFTVNTAEDEEHRSGKEDIWLTKPVKGDKNAGVFASIGKQWFTDIGVPLEIMGAPGFDLVAQKGSVLGTEGVLKVTAGNKGYTKKAFKKTAEASGVSESAVTVPADKAEEDLDMSKW